MGTHSGWNALSKELSIVDSDRFELMEQVASLRLAGKSDTAVAKELGIQRKVAIELFGEYKEIVKADRDSRDWARDHLDMMVKHYDRLIEKSYEVYRNLEFMSFDEKVAAQMNTTLKNISEYEGKRVDALQKAGLLEGAELGDEMAAMEEKHAVIIDILKNHLCEHCRPTVMSRLRAITGQVEPHETVVVVNENG